MEPSPNERKTGTDGIPCTCIIHLFVREKCLGTVDEGKDMFPKLK